MPPSVSAIIPCRNGERYLAASISSILTQPYTDLEVIVVDNGSTDASGEIARGFGDRVRIVEEPVPGIASARAAGIAAARGTIFAFCDADDLWGEGRLPAQIGHLDQLPALGVSTGLTQPFISEDVEGEHADFDTRPQFFRQPGAMLIRRTIFEQVGSFGIGVGHDSMEWIGRATDVGVTFGCFEHVVLHRRVHSGNHSRVEGLRTADFARSLKAMLDRRRAGTP